LAKFSANLLLLFTYIPIHSAYTYT